MQFFCDKNSANNLAIHEQLTKWFKLWQDRFLNSYLIEVSPNPNYTPTKNEIDELKNEVLCFTMASHLLWTLWAFVNVHQDIEFEYWVIILNRIQNPKGIQC